MFFGYIQAGGVFDPGAIVSGTVTSGDLGAGTVFSGNIASGQVSWPHIGSGAVQSGHIASGQVGSIHHASGQLTGFELGSGAIVSGRIASGQVGFGHLANVSVQSGTLASGLNAQSWMVEQIATVETVSGVRAVCLTSGGVVAIANAASGLLLPAIGVVVGLYSSGAAAEVFRFGKFITTSGLDATWSGMAGKLLYVGSGGIVVTQSGLLSGMGWQKLGVAYSGGMFVDVDLTVLSGGYTTPILGAGVF